MSEYKDFDIVYKGIDLTGEIEINYGADEEGNEYNLQTVIVNGIDIIEILNRDQLEEIMELVLEKLDV